METPLDLLRKAGMEIRCSTFQSQLAYNMVVDSILYLEGSPTGSYFQPGRFASQLLGGVDGAEEQTTVESP